jgi:osmotically-inducible protein OsmY
MVIADEKIKKNVIEEISSDGRVDASEVKVSVENGKVKLTGTVPSYEGKQAASENVWAIEGVSSVKNELIVVYPPKVKLPKDSEIRSDVKKALSLNLNIDEEMINLSVKKGILTLEGSVDSFWKKELVESVSAGISGIVDIKNKLSIVPTKRIKDKNIAEDIISAIDRNYKVQVEDVDVKVKDGIVTLSGTLDNWYAYNAAIESAKFTSGVKDLNDNFKIGNI